MVKILSNFVAFLENMNFCPILKLSVVKKWHIAQKQILQKILFVKKFVYLP